MSKKKTAVVIGSTGLVGKELIHLLLTDDDFDRVVSLSRRELDLSHPKLEQHNVDFNQKERWQELIQGDVLFSAMGTTIKQAKNKKQQYLVDYTYQYEVAEVAARNGVANYVLISSSGANSKSPFFYMKMKGELEEDIQKLPFKTIHILRPVQLMGNRDIKRPNETISVNVMRCINRIGLLKRFRPISGLEVAKEMIAASKNQNSSVKTLHG